MREEASQGSLIVLATAWLIAFGVASFVFSAAGAPWLVPVFIVGMFRYVCPLFPKD